MKIKEGGSAADAWNKIVTKVISDKEAEETILNLRKYCELDTFAMYKIWEELHDTVG